MGWGWLSGGTVEPWQLILLASIGALSYGTLLALLGFVIYQAGVLRARVRELENKVDELQFQLRTSMEREAESLRRSVGDHK